jgi:plasmid stabilization system protein ParE
MPHLIFTTPALRDLRRLHDFIAPKNPDAARRAATAIRRGVKSLEKRPLIGRPVDDIRIGCRELVIDFGQSAYLALYQIQGENVLILRVIHSREEGY